MKPVARKFYRPLPQINCTATRASVKPSMRAVAAGSLFLLSGCALLTVDGRTVTKSNPLADAIRSNNEGAIRDLVQKNHENINQWILVGTRANTYTSIWSDAYWEAWETPLTFAQKEQASPKTISVIVELGGKHGYRERR